MECWGERRLMRVFQKLAYVWRFVIGDEINCTILFNNVLNKYFLVSILETLVGLL